MLKRSFAFLFFGFAFGGNLVYCDEIFLKGIYCGENLVVKNPFSGNENTFCITEVLVNGKKTKDDIFSSSFEIDLNGLGLNNGDSLNIKIDHREGCTPKIMNPEALLSKGGFTITQIKFDKNGSLIWSTTKETSALPYIIEQFRWNKWMVIGEVPGTGKEEINNYSFQPAALHSGYNVFRLRQKSPRGNDFTSKEVKFRSAIPEIQAQVLKGGNTIGFSSETMYEIYDEFKTLIKSGKGVTLDLSDLKKKQIYWLSYDNKTIQFVPK